MNEHNKLIKERIEKIVPFIPTESGINIKSNKILILFSNLIYNDDNSKREVFIKIISGDQVYILIDKKVTCKREDVANIIKNINSDIDNIVIWLNKIQNPHNNSSSIMTHDNINVLYTVNNDNDGWDYTFTNLPMDLRKTTPFNIKEIKQIIKELKLFKNKLSRQFNKFKK